MAGSVNRVIIVGNIGANPEVKYLTSGKATCEMRVATNESYTDKQGQKVERTEWHRVIAWEKMAENCAQYLSKGRQVYIEGRLQTRSWDDKDGNKRYVTEIVAQNIQFLGGGGGGEGAPRDDGGGYRGGGSGGGGGGYSGGGYGTNRTAPAAAPASNDPPPIDEDIPF